MKTKALSSLASTFVLVGALLVLAGSVWAFVLNSQGASSAPVAVSNSVVKVLPCTYGRTQWLICPETVAIRCTTGPVYSGCGVASPAPSTTVGFYVAAGTCWLGNYPENQGATNITGIITSEVDCESTGASTNVDTLEFP